MPTVSKIFADKNRRIQRQKEGKCPCCANSKEDNGYYRCNKCMKRYRTNLKKRKK